MTVKKEMACEIVFARRLGEWTGRAGIPERISTPAAEEWIVEGHRIEAALSRVPHGATSGRRVEPQSLSE